MICDRCGEDRVREDAWLLAFPQASWPPVVFARLCRGCRRRLPWLAFHRAFFFVCCLGLIAAVAGAGVGLVYLTQWLIKLSST